MKITKRQLRKIIKEEKSKLDLEMKTDGTISDDEGDNEDQLVYDVMHELGGLITRVLDEAERIGGPFRSPGIKSRLFKAMADEIHKAR